MLGSGYDGVGWFGAVPRFRSISPLLSLTELERGFEVDFSLDWAAIGSAGPLYLRVSLVRLINLFILTADPCLQLFGPSTTTSAELS
jgi:hypothetical protein